MKQVKREDKELNEQKVEKGFQRIKIERKKTIEKEKKVE